MQGLMNRGMSEGGRPLSPRSRSQPANNSSSFSFQIRAGTGGPATFTVGGPSTLGGNRRGPDSPGRPPNMTEFLHRGGDDAPGIGGPLMAQYLMALLGHRGPNSDIFGLGDAAERGRMGDYVFNQEALDEIITNLMENSNASRPVPATDEIIDKLPREVLETESPMLEKDCAVCKEQFQLGTDDPDEQIVVSLPCGHPFHSPCILPWLKSSGTCPVCRHQLVPQPEHHPLPPSGSSPPGGNRPSRAGGGGGADGGFLQSLFTSMGSGNPRSSTTRRSSNPSNGQGDAEHHLPGSWDDELD